MQLLLSSLTREKTTLVFKSPKVLEAVYDETTNTYSIYDKEFGIFARSNKGPIYAVENYSDKLYGLYLLYKDADTSKMDDEDLRIKEKINELKVTP